MNKGKTNMFNANNLSLEAKAACKALHFTPRQFEALNTDRPSCASGPEDAEYPVLRVWNSRREIVLTNQDVAYAANFL